MINDLILKYNALVPRYTSYPTAPHFNNDFNKETYIKWLSELPNQKPISLYIHIPFCRKLCWFCGCNTKITQKYSPLESYMPALLSEIKFIAQLFNNSQTISQIHFGGGSPNILNDKDFTSIISTINKYFCISKDAEIAMEVDPRHITNEQIQTYSSNGVNRISIGVQDFNHNTQKAINREQPYELILETVSLLHKHNIDQINLDFIYGLPKQTISSMEKNIDLALTLNPSRLSIFGYAHVPWMKKHMRLIHEEDLPDNKERLKIFQIAEKKLNDANYTSIGIDHFAKQDDEMSQSYLNKSLRRNFQGYVTDIAPTLIGLGTSSIGYIENLGYVQNNSSTHEYKDLITKETLPIGKGKIMNKKDLLHYDIIMHLMCYFEINLEDYCKKHNVKKEYFDPYIENLQEFITDNLVSVNNYNIKIDPRAKQLVRIICSTFDQYYNNSQKKHSKTV